MRKIVFFMAIAFLLMTGASSVWIEEMEEIQILDPNNRTILVGMDFNIPPLKTGEMFGSIKIAEAIAAEVTPEPEKKKEEVKKEEPPVIEQKPVEAEKKVAVPKKTATKKTHSKKSPVCKSSCPEWSKTGANPFRGNLERDIKFLNFQDPRGLLGEVEAKRFVWVNAFHKNHPKYPGLVVDKKGRIFRPIVMLSGGGPNNPIDIKTGPNGVIHNWPRVDTGEAGKLYENRDEYLVTYLKCGNPTRLILISIPPTPAPLVEAPKPIPPIAELPPIFKEVKIERTCTSCENELDLGGGKWWNEDNTVDGWWWFAQYKLYLENCGKYQKQVAGGIMTPFIGLFARGDSGETDSGYEWDNWGIGPQAGFRWDAITENGYPQQVQFAVRSLWEFMEGDNPSVEYSKDEQHFLIGEYAEYLRRFAPDKMNVFYVEGLLDINDYLKSSTWSGDSTSDRTSLSVGYKFHKDWNDVWASRFGVQIGLLPHDNQWGLNGNIEMRYNDWLIFGPSLDYVISSDIANVAGGFAYGGLVRFEFKQQVRKKYSVTMMEQVRPADHQLLKY